MTDDKLQTKLRRLPGVDSLLAREELTATGLSAAIVKRAARRAVDLTRQQVLDGGEPDLTPAGVAGLALDLAQEMDRPNFRRVINATGVVVHTNLGRSLLAKEALEAVTAFSATYTNLEFDLEVGKRGSRYSHVVDLVTELTGAEAALVVNNNAGAVLLSLNALGQGREVVVSRGQLVEIGGSFRIPEVMARSGARLIEVGATNKTHLRDYEAAITDQTAGLLKVHQSNFAMVGFQQVVGLPEMSELAQKYKLWLMEDLGSGCLIDLARYGFTPEPTVTESLAQGADVVTFSGDKLLGGPQAGLIVGKAEAIDKIKVNPINRAVRIDKMTLAALEATLRLYRDPERVVEKIPTLRMLTASSAALSRRAGRLRSRLKRAGGPDLETTLMDQSSQVGGGALPLQQLPTKLVAIRLKGRSAAALELAFRRPQTIGASDLPPVIGRIIDDWLTFDPRTLQPGDDACLADLLARLVAGTRS